MNKNLFRKVICFTIALLMLVPNMPGNYLFADTFEEENSSTQQNILDEFQGIESTITTASSIKAKPLAIETDANGSLITVSGDTDIIPYGTIVSARLIEGNEALDYLNAIEQSQGFTLDNPKVFDINLLNEDGEKIQPNGDVEVNFSGLGFENDEEVYVYHVELESEKYKGFSAMSFGTGKKSRAISNDIKVNDMSARFNGSTVKFNTNHFSIYVVGTPQSYNATYKFYVNDELYDTQIVLNNSEIVKPATPTAPAGKKFIGWYAEGTATPLVFGEPITLTQQSTEITVNAMFAEGWYVYFVYDQEVIETKEVANNSNTNDSNVPLVVDIPGKAFSHWSTTINGTAFDFNTPITADTTLYAVLIDRWKVTFDTVGGTTLLPMYVINGYSIGSVPVTTRPGYEFKYWSLSSGGAQYELSSPVTNSIKLYAVWQAVNSPYTVIYWQENANDNGYSYYETVNKTGLTGNTATFDNKSYNGFNLNSVKTNAENVVILGDGSSIKNVYYDRNRYTLEFKSKQNNAVLKTFNNIKQGADTSPWWNQAVTAYPTFTWYTTKTGNVAYSLAPDMPNSNLTIYGAASGDTKYIIYYLEDVAGYPNIQPPYEFTGVNGLYLTIEDYIEFPGFTVKSTPKDGSQNSYYNKELKRYEWKIYYTRNKYDIKFQKNDLTGNQTISNILYEADISNKVLANYVVNQTTRYDGYIFDGWYDNSETVGTPFNFTGAKMPANNLILYAKWSAPIHILKYHLSSDTTGTYQTIGSIQHGDNITIDKLIGKIIPEGLTENDFIGWYWFVDGNFVPYDFNLPITVDTIVLYPVWNSLTYSVIYDKNGGTGTVPSDNNLYINGALAAVLPPTGITPPEGKVFIGWKESVSNQLYYPNNKLIINGNKTLIAQYGDVVQDTQLIYDGNGGVVASDPSKNQLLVPLKNNATHVVMDNAFEREGYVFKGWNTKADGSGTSINPSAEIVVSNFGENKLYALWNCLPVAVDDAITTSEDTEIDINVLVNDSDIDGDTLTVTTVTQPTNGSVSINNDGTVKYTPSLNFSGTDSFTYTISDGNGGTSTATVTVTVTPVNDAPVAVNDAYSVDEDETLTVTLPGVLTNDTDADLDALTAVLVTGPANGTLTLNADGSFTYTPNANFNGTDSFTYKANDGTIDSNIATVTITVNAKNDAPVAVNDAYSVDEDTVLTIPANGVLTNDTDADLDALTAVLVTGPANGTLVLNADGSFTYTPNANFNGTDSFTYKANDGTIDSNIATVTITVNAVGGGGGGGTGGTGGGGGNPPVIIVDPEVPLADLEKSDHFAYIIGYPDGNVKPMGKITREEVAMIFYRLLTDDSRNEWLSDSNPFNDLKGHDWSNRAISTLYNAGIIKGYPDGTFKPSDPITRAEFATIAAKFDKLELQNTSTFTDIFGHWAEKYITSSEIKGWIKGYPDNTFKPEQAITRAESMTLINNVLERKVPEENIHPDAMFWPDIMSDDWYYEAVMEATNSHDYMFEEDGDELWTGMKANKVWP